MVESESAAAVGCESGAAGTAAAAGGKKAKALVVREKKA